MWGIYKYKAKEYIYTIAIGIDQLGGSILYNKINWTVSGWTYVLARRAERGKEKDIYLEFEGFINFLFRDPLHCKNAYKWELKVNAQSELMKKGL